MYNTENQQVTNRWGGQRNQSIELLRIAMMSLIVFGHVIGHGMRGMEGNANAQYVPYLYPLYFYHVDAFVFISGYYGIKLKWSKFLLLIAKMDIYSIVAVGLVAVLSNNVRMGVSDFIHNIYPISACDWWFMSQYLFLMLLAPIINKGVDALDKKTLTILVFVLYLSWFRCTSVLLLFIYILGRYLRKYPFKPLQDNAGKVFVGTVALSFVVNYFLIDKGIELKKLYDYMSPFAVIPAVALFYLFKRWNLQWQGIGFAASGVLAAYLITDHELLRPIFTRAMCEMTNTNFLLIAVASIAIVILCSLVDRLFFHSYQTLRSR